MATTDIGIQHGATVAYESTPGSGTYNTTISNVRGITPPAPEKEVHDKTHLGSTGTYREKFTGLMDTGPMTLRCLFSEAGRTAALTAFVLGETGWKITTAEGSTLTFTGEVTKVGDPELADDELEYTIEVIRTTGVPVWTESPS